MDTAAIQAIDPRTGEKKWEYKMADVVDAGVLSTASDLLFSGGREGYALRARRQNRRAAVEGERRRLGLERADDVLARRAGSTWRLRPAARCSCTRCRQ